MAIVVFVVFREVRECMSVRGVSVVLVAVAG